MAKQLTQALIEQWISLTKGQFNVHDIWAEIGIDSPEGKKYLRTILDREEIKGTIKRVDKGFGNYRVLDNEAPLIDWENADPENFLPLVLPFDIQNFCHIYPKSVIIVAGSKQEGKTAFLLSCIKPNLEQFVVDLYNSETGPEQLKGRLQPLDFPKPAPFYVYERYDNFADVINPTHLSIIDYLDLNSEVYLAGAEIDAIFRKLTTGCAIIGMQKPPPSFALVKGVKKEIERDLAYGGGFTAKRATLYLSLGKNRLKVVHAKTPASPKLHPNNMQWTFTFDEHGFFSNIQRYQPLEPDPF